MWKNKFHFVSLRGTRMWRIDCIDYKSQSVSIGYRLVSLFNFDVELLVEIMKDETIHEIQQNRKLTEGHWAWPKCQVIADTETVER